MMREPCDHTDGPGSTLRVVCSTALGVWAAGCRACGRFTEYVLTKEEAMARAKKGWWAK